ncbi:uncharacterized protein LOC135649121 [Musa acuminata AAA Group]|uniref:uncharacterized protein LOC135649121 n=1 Tax=Musa acuminata AAA Group TaxID=214697 RepID=UPI0031E11228
MSPPRNPKKVHYGRSMLLVPPRYLRCAPLNPHVFDSELRVSDLKKRLLELQNDLNVANADLDGAKRSREMVEQELRGSQVQLSMIGASIQAQEARISLLQEEILKLRSDLDTLKSEVGFMRDEFVNSMCELNKKIRSIPTCFYFHLFSFLICLLVYDLFVPNSLAKFCTITGIFTF